MDLNSDIWSDLHKKIFLKTANSLKIFFKFMFI